MRFDTERFKAIEGRFSYEKAEEQWRARMAHNPCRLALSGGFESDLKFLRHPHEESYVRHLQALIPSNSRDVHFDFKYYLSSSPYADAWWDDRQSRYPKECRFEHRLRSQQNLFVGYHNVEFHTIPRSERRGLYLDVPSWWSRYEVTRGILVPLPAVVAYRGSEMARGGPLATDLWCVLFTEWIIGVLATLISRAYRQKQVWWVSPCLLKVFRRMDLALFVASSDYSVEHVRRVINAIDHHSTEENLWVQPADRGAILGHYLLWDPQRGEVITPGSEELEISPETVVPDRLLGSVATLRRFRELTGCSRVTVSHICSFLDGVLSPEAADLLESTSITDLQARLSASLGLNQMLEQQLNARRHYLSSHPSGTQGVTGELLPDEGRSASEAEPPTPTPAGLLSGSSFPRATEGVPAIGPAAESSLRSHAKPPRQELKRTQLQIAQVQAEKERLAEENSSLKDRLVVLEQKDIIATEKLSAEQANREEAALEKENLAAQCKELVEVVKVLNERLIRNRERAYKALCFMQRAALSSMGSIGWVWRHSNPSDEPHLSSSEALSSSGKIRSPRVGEISCDSPERLVLAPVLEDEPGSKNPTDVMDSTSPPENINKATETFSCSRLSGNKRKRAPPS